MGPLEGLRVVEFAGLGPCPYAGMLLADLGADVRLVERPGHELLLDASKECTLRGKTRVLLDLKTATGRQVALEMIDSADVLLEGFRPGVMERLGLGPEVALDRNPRLVFGRMTGWGQTGPLAQAAGHDINYIALSGALAAIGPPDDCPIPPLNLVGDFGGGGLFLVMGVLAALYERERSGLGQVIDAAMTEGSASLMAMMHSWAAQGMWATGRGSNLLDGGAPFYRSYRTRDGRYVAVGSLEPRFYRLLIEKAGLPAERFPAEMDSARWPELREALRAAFLEKTREEWCEIMEGTDVCFAPVLDYTEAPDHPHNRARGSFVELDGMVQPGPAPRFSRTPAEIRGARPIR